MKLEWLQTLADVYRLGSFSAVAKQRGVSVMAISKQISALEASVGESLVNRSRRQISLTDTGQMLLNKGSVLLQEHQAVRDWLDERHNMPSGKLTVVCLEADVVALSLTPWLAEFQRRYPGIELEIRVEPKFASIDVDQADIFWGFGRYLGDIVPGLKARPMVTVRFGIYAHPSYLQQFGVPKTPADLKRQGHRVIGNTNNTPSNILIVRDGDDFQDGDMAGVYLPAPVTTSTGLLEMAEQGLGLINCSDMLLRRLSATRPVQLTPVLTDFWVSDIESYTFYHQVKYEQSKVRAFLDFFCARLSRWVDDD